MDEDWEDDPGRLLRWLGGLYADLTEGQRWTIALVLVLTIVFVGFGLRR